LDTAFEGVVQHLSRLSSTQMCLGLLLFVCAVVGTGARPPNSSQFEIQPPSMFQYLGGLVSANFHWPYNCKAQGCGLSLIYIWHVSPRSSFLSMGLTAAKLLWAVGGLVSTCFHWPNSCCTYGCLKMLLAQSSQIVPEYACSFATRVLNHTPQFNSAAQQRSGGRPRFRSCI
jgi:hypothetical protein